MSRNNKFITLLCLCALVLFSACNKTPETASYIPSDAMMVVGLNTKEIGKKLAWEIITGNDLFKKLTSQGKDGDSSSPLKGIENAGIRFTSTSYFYTKTDARFDGGNRHSIIVPLDDAGKWEAYIKRVLKDHPIKEQDGYKQMMLNDDCFAGWNKEVLVLMNVIKTQSQAAGDPNDPYANLYGGGYAVDTAQTIAELTIGMKSSKDNSLLKDAKFAAQQKENHDISVWLNYEKMMNSVNTGGVDISMMRSFWKDNIMTGSLDFENGKIVAEMKYFTSEEMKATFKDFGKNNVDKEMLDRIAAKNLNMIVGAQMSFSSLKGTLDKMGYTALANGYLQPTGLTMDNVLNALSGDIVMAMNDFALVKVPAQLGMERYGADEDYNPDMNMLYALKIGKKEDFNKVFSYLDSQKVITAAGPNTYIMGSPEAPTMVIMMDDKYVAFSNKKEIVAAWMEGKNKGQKMNDVAHDVVYDHPVGMFFDIKQLTAGINKMPYSSYKDSVLLQEAKTRFDHVSFTTDAFKDDHYASRMELVFQNKDENSLLQLFAFGMKMQEATQKQNELFQKEMEAAAAEDVADTTAMAPTVPNGR